jgi:predicted transcriptional regulator
MERKPKAHDELEELREENKRLREIVAELIQRRIADAIEPPEQSARAED